MLHKISDPLIIMGKSLVFGNYILVIYNKSNTVKKMICFQYPQFIATGLGSRTMKKSFDFLCGDNRT